MVSWRTPIRITDSNSVFYTDYLAISHPVFRQLWTAWATISILLFLTLIRVVARSLLILLDIIITSNQFAIQYF